MRYFRIIILSIILLISIVIVTPLFADSKQENTKIIVNTGNLKLQKSENVDIITYDYINEDNKLIYSWIFDKSSLDDYEKLNMDMDFENDSIDTSEFQGISKILSFDHHGELPKNTKVKVYVKDDYSPNKKLNMYYYDDDVELFRYEGNYVVDDEGYVIVDLEHCSDYVLTGAIIQDAANNPGNISIIIFVLIGVIIILIGSALFSNKK